MPITAPVHTFDRGSTYVVVLMLATVAEPISTIGTLSSATNKPQLGLWGRCLKAGSFCRAVSRGFGHVFVVRSHRLCILRLASIEFGEVAAGARSETGLLR